MLVCLRPYFAATAVVVMPRTRSASISGLRRLEQIEQIGFAMVRKTPAPKRRLLNSLNPSEFSARHTEANKRPDGMGWPGHVGVRVAIWPPNLRMARGALSSASAGRVVVVGDDGSAERE